MAKCCNSAGNVAEAAIVTGIGCEALCRAGGIGGGDVVVMGLKNTLGIGLTAELDTASGAVTYYVVSCKSRTFNASRGLIPLP